VHQAGFIYMPIGNIHERNKLRGIVKLIPSDILATAEVFFWGGRGVCVNFNLWVEVFSSYIERC